MNVMALLSIPILAAVLCFVILFAVLSNQNFPGILYFPFPFTLFYC